MMRMRMRIKWVPRTVITRMEDSSDSINNNSSFSSWQACTLQVRFLVDSAPIHDADALAETLAVKAVRLPQRHFADASQAALPAAL